jgi:hypothetical protein
MNTLVANRILETVDDMILCKKVFTAYDVTIAARLNTSDRIDHDDVRTVIADQYVSGSMPDYNRAARILDLLSSQPHAVIYYPDGLDADDHALVSAAPTIIEVGDDTDGSTAAVVDAIANTVSLDDDEYKTTKEGRVQIPRKLTCQVKASQSGVYDLLINGTYRGAKTDARGDIRIGLKQFGITDSKVKLTVDIIVNTINIETV